MKRKYKVHTGKKVIEREYNYIPVRYIIAMLITVLEIIAIIGIVVLLCYYVPLFYIAAMLTQVFCVLRIVASDDNPDYKVPWLLFVLILPVAGFMLYFIFSSRTLKKKYIERLNSLKNKKYERDDAELFERLKAEDVVACNQARMLTAISESCLFTDTHVKYFPLGEDMLESLLRDLSAAEKFIYMEYFIIEEGCFWNPILELLTKKVREGVEVKLIYDDIGCMSTLPGDYAKRLQKKGIEATPFSRLRGSADSEFNNRSHRKITVIDGLVGYTGGVNIADEYINKRVRFGHWKDTAIRLEGEAVWELTRLFLIDYGINVKKMPSLRENPYPSCKNIHTGGYLIPFGDGPKPLYEHRIGKCAIRNMLNAATEYAYITTPYLIIDNELCSAIETAALRGVDVRIVLPHVPDKKLVFAMSRSFYPRLMKAGVKIYQYEPGFIHAKNYLVDGKYAMIGTINLDYRSLVHHFENGVWLYGCDVISDIEADMRATIEESIPITEDMLKLGLFRRIFYAMVRVFAPLM